MIAVIRITGQIGLNKDIKETLQRLKLKRKYSCVVIITPTSVQLGMIKKVENFVAYGNINDAIFKELVKKRGKESSEGKDKLFFRLPPPRGGIETKKHFGVGKGVLGNHKDKINELIGRML